MYHRYSQPAFARSAHPPASSQFKHRAASISMDCHTNCSAAVIVFLDSKKPRDLRTIELRPYEPAIIGRASKSEVKNLAAASNNALFDCPVVSRTHAELMNTPLEKAGAEVSIVDCSSLHGTWVNGKRLVAGQRVVLQSGDAVKLGDLVTRGDDVHDGMSFTFNRSQDESSYSPNGSSVARGFHAPPSVHDGTDYESDDDSLCSYGDQGPSTKTTPDQPKSDLQSVIADAVDAGFIPESLPNMVYPVAPSDTRADVDNIIDLSQLSSDEESLLSESSVIEDEFDGAEDEPESAAYDPLRHGVETDLQSESGASDFSNAWRDGWSRYDSPEVGGVVLESPAVPAGTPEINRNQPSLLAAKVSPNFTPTSNDYVAKSKPRYDPVRNSQPPAEEDTAGSTTAKFTEKAPSINSPWGQWSLGDPYQDLANEIPINNRWDIAPPLPPSNSFGNFITASCTMHTHASHPAPPPPPPPPQVPTMGYYPQFSSGLYDSVLSNTNTSAAQFQPQASLVQPVAATTSSWLPPHLENSETLAQLNPPATKSKIAIVDILEEPNDTMAEVQETKAGADSSTNVSAPCGTKRKAADTETEEPSKKQKSGAKSTANGARIERRRSVARRGLVRKVATNAAKYATGAMVGMVATVAFLNSDAAQNLIEWLA